MSDAYRWDFGAVFGHLDILLVGLKGTLVLFAISLAIGLAIGLVVGAARYARHPMLNWPATAYVELFRNTPVLVQLMWFYYAFPILSGVQMSAFAAAALSLSLNTSAFCAEIFRGGIQSIVRGQWEAGRALGMGYVPLMRRIILPQAVKRMIPAFTNRALELAKMTTLASTIAVAELLYQGRLLTSVNYRPIETYTVIALIYVTVLYSATVGVERLERHLRRGE